MPPRTPRAVRYRGRDDHPLRLALLDVWGWCCYWRRREPLIPSETEIDHIIPDSIPADRLAELITQLGLPADFDLTVPGISHRSVSRATSRRATATSSTLRSWSSSLGSPPGTRSR
jgi:hypothetical protein